MTLRNIAKAVGAYERTLVTPSPFDAYLAGNQEALSSAARAGLAMFINTGCMSCHNGVGVGGGMYQKFGVVENYWKATGSDPIDKGRADVTKGSSGNKRAIWGISIRRDSVVPLAVELGALDVDGGHLGVRDDNATGVLASVEFAAHGEAGFGGGGRDQFGPRT